MMKYRVADPEAVASVIERALFLLDRYGWSKGIFKNSRGERCVTGALYDASQGWRGDTFTDAARCIKSHMLRTYCWGHIALEAYNDDPRTRKRGIRRLLHRTLRTLETQIRRDKCI